MAIEKKVEAPLYYFSRMDKPDKLSKFAEASKIDPLLLEKAREIYEKREHPRNAVFIAIIVTGFEYFSANENGDAFFEEIMGEYVRPEDTLPVAYSTFTGKPVNRYHQSSGENSNIGKIHFAYYNENQHRVEIVCELYWDKAPTECLKIKRNVALNMSMCCKTSVDYCSFCGNAADTLDNHCDHVKYSLTDLIEGVPIFMINKPDFSEASIVIIGGDPSAKVVYTVNSKLNS